MVARRVVNLAGNENMEVEMNAAEALVESCGNDIRQVMNALQMWASAGKKDRKDKGSNEKVTMRYMDFKERKGEIGKDEMLRVSMFDAGKMIMVSGVRLR